MRCQPGESLCVAQRNHRVPLIGDGHCYSGYTSRPGTRAPCHGKRRTSRRTICTLCACERVASVDGVVVVQHDYELALSRPVGRLHGIVTHAKLGDDRFGRFCMVGVKFQVFSVTSVVALDQCR